MAPTGSNEVQISQLATRIKALKANFQQADSMLESLLNEEAAIMATSAYHRRTLSSFQNMPDNVLREICLAFIGPEMPLLIPSFLPLPYTLMQISSGVRRIVLTTPFIWASIKIQIDEGFYFAPDKELYTALVWETRRRTLCLQAPRLTRVSLHGLQCISSRVH